MRGLPVESTFSTAYVHVPGSDELALFHVDRAASVTGGDEQISLAAEKGWDLQDVGGFSGDFAVEGS